MPFPAIGLAPLGFLELAPPDFIAIAAEAGFASVGLRTRAAVLGGAEYPLASDPVLMRRTQQVIADTGLQVSSIEQIGLFRDTAVDALRPMLEAGARIGATRVLCSGDDEDHAVVADRFAQLCAAAAEFGLTVDLEFMPFRAVRTLEQARDVIVRSRAENGAIAIDALHLIRSGGSPASLAGLDPKLVGCIQLCDAPAAAPPAGELALEARERRLLPGDGELPLERILQAVGAGRSVDAEVPLGHARPDLTLLERAQLIHAATARLLTADRPLNEN
jgi:sugar phosphate isomerase/epimerase